MKSTPRPAVTPPPRLADAPGRHTTAALAAVLLLLSACGTEPKPARPDAASSAAQTAPQSAATGSAGSSPPAAPTDADSTVTSSYTSTDIKGCEAVLEIAEGGSSSYKCPGFNGIAIYVKEGDLRQDLDAGVEAAFETESPFNHLGKQVEWRHKTGGKPYAIIYRLSSDPAPDMLDKATSWLIVESIGTKGRPGCRTGVVEAAEPDANVKARQIADRLASGPQPCLRDSG